MAGIKPIHQIISAMADQARMDRRPPPVIETDYRSARILCDAICDSIGGGLVQDLRAGLTWPHMMTFDGVKIVVRRIQPEELYREHFGVLADLWDNVDALS